MKYLKIFEKITEKHKVDNYVLIYLEEKESRHYIEDKGFINFINTHIGQITSVYMNEVVINYPDVPQKYKNCFVTSKYNNNHNIITFFLDQIVASASTIEELKLKIMANKYNL